MRAAAVFIFVLTFAAAGDCQTEATSGHDSLAKILSEFHGTATSAQFEQLKAATEASPSLEAQLDRLARAGRLKRIELVAPGDQRFSGTPFAARAVGDEIVMTSEFLQAQAPRRLYDVVGPEDVLPDNLVFVLGHLAHHLEQPFHLDSPPPTREAFIALKLADEARAYVAGWNDMAEAALGASVPSIARVGSMILNFRYRSVIVKIISDNESTISPSGRIELSPQNVEILAKVLETSDIPGFD